MQRKTYIDSLRGLAILLVVMGHVFDNTFKHGGLANNMIYTFHMPLFMFISGLVSFQKDDYSFLFFVKAKAQRLLLPFVIVGFISCIPRGLSFFEFIRPLNKTGFWYLPNLFEILLMVYPMFKLLRRVNPERAPWKDVVLYALPWLCAMGVYRFIAPQWNDILMIQCIVKLYPFFVFGMLLTKYEVIERFIMNDWVKALCIVGSVSIYAIVTTWNVGGLGLVAPFVVPFLYVVFKTNKSVCNILILNKLGGGNTTGLFNSLLCASESYVCVQTAGCRAAYENANG